MILEDQYLEFIIKHNLTQGQLLLLILVYKNRPDLIRAYKSKFPTGTGNMIGTTFIKDLINRGFLVEKNDTYEVGEKFREIYIDKHRATEEIFDIYPSYYNKQNLHIPLVGMDRNVFANLYEAAIMGSLKEHEQIKLDIKYGKEKRMINMGIEKFLRSKYWTAIRKDRIISKTVLTTTTHDEEFFEE